MMALALREVSLMNFILRISKEVKWRVEASMDNIFILEFLHILQELSIFWNNLFVRGILSISEV